MPRNRAYLLSHVSTIHPLQPPQLFTSPHIRLRMAGQCSRLRWERHGDIVRWSAFAVTAQSRTRGRSQRARGTPCAASCACCV